MRMKYENGSYVEMSVEENAEFDAMESDFNVSNFTSMKNRKIAEINTARDAACTANVSTLGRVWQADKRNMELLSQSITLAGAGLPLPAYWRDASNSNMAVSGISDLLAIAGAAALQTEAAYAHSWTLKAQIEAATTLSELEAIGW